jgi:hypothetical protein
LQSKILTLSSANESKCIEVEELLANIEALKVDHRLKCAELEVQYSRILALNEENNHKQESIASLSIANQLMITEIDDLKSQISTWKTYGDMASSESEYLKLRTSSLTNEIKELYIRIESLQVANVRKGAEVEEYNARIAALTTESNMNNAVLTSKIELKDAEIENLKIHISTSFRWLLRYSTFNVHILFAIMPFTECCSAADSLHCAEPSHNCSLTVCGCTHFGESSVSSVRSTVYNQEQVPVHCTCYLLVFPVVLDAYCY